MNHRVIKRIDLDEADEDDVAIAGVDEEVEADLKKEAIYHKWRSKSDHLEDDAAPAPEKV